MGVMCGEGGVWCGCDVWGGRGVVWVWCGAGGRSCGCNLLSHGLTGNCEHSEPTSPISTKAPTKNRKELTTQPQHFYISNNNLECLT